MNLNSVVLCQLNANYRCGRVHGALNKIQMRFLEGNVIVHTHKMTVFMVYERFGVR